MNKITIYCSKRFARNPKNRYATYSEAPRNGFIPITVTKDNFQKYANERFIISEPGSSRTYKRGSDCDWFKMMSEKYPIINP